MAGCSVADCYRTPQHVGMCLSHYRRWRKYGSATAIEVPSDFTAGEWFWRQVDRSEGPDACWPWTRYVGSHGYGRSRHGYAHRYALELALGRKLRPGMEAAHSCDNRICCNPAHLREADRVENMADAAERNRMHIGERNPRAKLTLTQVEAIRTSSYDDAHLALFYGVTPTTIRRIRTGQRWAKAA